MGVGRDFFAKVPPDSPSADGCVTALDDFAFNFCICCYCYAAHRPQSREITTALLSERNAVKRTTRIGSAGSALDCFSRGGVLAGCGSPVETSAAGRSTDRADRRDLPLLSVRINLHPAEQAGKTHPLGDNQRLKILIVMLCLSCFQLFFLFEFHGFRDKYICGGLIDLS